MLEESAQLLGPHFIPNVALYLTSVSFLCFIFFAWDKYCAIKNRWRVPERNLLMLAFIGGTPGAFLAQILLRHKTKKQPFKGTLQIIALFQIAVIILFVFTGSLNYLLNLMPR